MPSLSAEEKRELQRAVSEHGRDWRAVAASRDWGGRSADVLRMAWDAQCALGVVAAAESVADPAEEALLAGPVAAVQPLPEGVARGAARCLHSGRPWDYITQRGGPREAPREPTDLQKVWIKNWSLHNARGNGLLICNLKRASAKLRRYFGRQAYTHATVDELMLHAPIPSKLRDQLGMVVYPGQSGATITRGCAGLNWLGGELMGEGRFATACEVAAFMGICASSGPYCVAKRYYTDYQLCGLLAEAVHSKVGDYAATVTRLQLNSTPLTVGSMYSGTFDVLGSSCQRAFPGLRRSFVSESDPTKLRVLWESFGPDRCYADVADIDGRHPAHLLVASPPCLVFSKANRSSTAEGQVATAQRQVAHIRRAIRLLSPLAVIIEQTEGLMTHCPLAYGVYLALWEGLGYRVYRSVVDARDACGASHHRARLIWVAFRERA